MSIYRKLLALLTVSALFLGACSAATDEETVAPDAEATNEAITGSATVFAAASLTESFTAIKERFELDNPGATVALNFAASSALAAQITEQGGADVFASADQANMDKVTDQVDSPQVFARNRLAIIVGSGNPKGIAGLADLAKPDLRVILAGATVPVGRYGAEALGKANVTVSPVSEAVDVKGVVGPVTLGEADAGIVYTTDVIAAGDNAAGVEIPDDQNVIAEYPIAVIKDSPNAEVAQAFLEAVLSEEGQQILADHGFIIS